MALLTRIPAFLFISIFIIFINQEEFDFAFILIFIGILTNNNTLKLIGFFILLQENISQNFDILDLVLLIVFISRQKNPIASTLILLLIFLGNEEMGLPFNE
jgi:hypothetical protein